VTKQTKEPAPPRGVVRLSEAQLAQLDKWVDKDGYREVAEKIGVCERTLGYVLMGRGVHRATYKVMANALNKRQG
jgi:hypothetical protein